MYHLDLLDLPCGLVPQTPSRRCLSSLPDCHKRHAALLRIRPAHRSSTTNLITAQSSSQITRRYPEGTAGTQCRHLYPSRRRAPIFCLPLNSKGTSRQRHRRSAVRTIPFIRRRCSKLSTTPTAQNHLLLPIDPARGSASGPYDPAGLPGYANRRMERLSNGGTRGRLRISSREPSHRVLLQSPTIGPLHLFGPYPR